MSEEQNQTQETQGAEREDTSGGDKPEAEVESPIERANAAAERLEKANAEQKELLRQAQELEARRRLGGFTSGQQPVKQELTDEEFTQKSIRGEIPKEEFFEPRQ